MGGPTSSDMYMCNSDACGWAGMASEMVTLKHGDEMFCPVCHETAHHLTQDEAARFIWELRAGKQGAETVNITQVAVSSHEKRNHPHEYGHYDAEVRFTAELAPGENAVVRTRELQQLAGLLVAEKCDGWIEGIERARKMEEVGGAFRSKLNRATYVDDEAEMEKRLAELDAWALDQAQEVGDAAVSELRARIEPARKMWRAIHTHGERAESEQGDDEAGFEGDPEEDEEYDLDF